jgi:hypothetical protein
VGALSLFQRTVTERNSELRPVHAGSASATPEMQLLLCCARVRLAPEEVSRVLQLLATPLDWDRLFRLASWHRLLPLVSWHLGRVAPQLRDEPGFADLQRFSLENAGRALQLIDELLQLLRLFRAHDIPAVPYKGPLMAARLYGNFALRQVGDLDVLIRKRDVPAARALLLSHGYVSVYAEADAVRKFKLEYGYCEDYHSSSGTPLELHWAFTNGDVHFPVLIEDLLPRLQTVSVGGTQVLSFASEDLLLILCVHGAKHRWERLEWVCSIAELLRASGELAWTPVLARAAELGSVRTLLVGMLLAHKMLGAPLPAQVLERIHAHRPVAELVAELQSRLLGPDGEHQAGATGSLARDLYMLQLRDGVQGRLEYLWHRCSRRIARVHRSHAPLSALRTEQLEQRR